MILGVLLLLQAAPVDEVTVIARSLDRFRAAVAFTDAGPQCRIKVSTGDAEIDRVGCTAIETCHPAYQSRLAGTSDRAVRPDVRKVMRAALKSQLDECIAAETKTGIAALAAKRKAA